MRKTKIICTLGPSTDDPEVLKQLMLNGMDVARVNMSHQDHDAQRVRIGAVKKLREELNPSGRLAAGHQRPGNPYR